MYILISSLGFILRGGFRWSLVELMVSVLWTPIVAYFATGLLGGITWSENIAMLSQKVLLTMVVCMSTPFVLGVLAGSLFLPLRDKVFRRNRSQHT
jgi:hypothetical protein